MKRHALARLVISSSLLIPIACSHLPRKASTDTLRCIQAARAADSNASRYTWGSSNDELWVARYEPRSKATVWKTRIGASGETSVRSVSNLNESGIIVAGSSTAESLPGSEPHGVRQRRGFVMRLSTDRGEVLSRTNLNETGSELHGATVMRDGRVLVVGTGGGAAGYSAAPLPRMKQVWTEGRSPATAQHAFLAVYTADLRHEIGRLDLGPQTERHPRVWLDCNGDPVVGTVVIANGECAGGYPDLVYEQGQFGQNYDIDHDFAQTATLGNPPGGWGFHALRWKAYHSGAALPWPAFPSSPAVPKSAMPSCPDAQTLNALEVTEFTPSNPTGWWQCGQHTGLANLALVSAYMFSKWTTPVYTHVQRWHNLNGPWTKVVESVAIERVVFHPVCPTNANAYSGQRIEDLCNLTVDDIANVGCAASEAAAGMIGNGYFLRVERFEGARWNNGFTSWYVRPVTYLANPGTFFWQQWYESGDYVYDPPEGAEGEQAAIQQAAQQLGRSIVRQQRVIISTTDRGRVTSRRTIEALTPADE